MFSVTFWRSLKVLQALQNLDLSKSSGPDEASQILLKNCAIWLSAPLQLIYNFSLSTRIFPSRWKSSYLTPIHKSGSRNDIGNYRGVAILPILGKIFELLVCRRMTEELSGKISTKQHGFMKGRSTITNLMEFVTYTLNVIESRSQVDVTYTDMRKV